MGTVVGPWLWSSAKELEEFPNSQGTRRSRVPAAPPGRPEFLRSRNSQGTPQAFPLCSFDGDEVVATDRLGASGAAEQHHTLAVVGFHA